MAGRGAKQGGLLDDLRGQVKLLEDDLRERSDEEPFASSLTEEYNKAREAGRIAATYGAWRDERVTQVAAAWVLGTLFVRFCEDNGLVEYPWIAGPGDRLEIALGRHEAFFRANPERNDRDWLTASFEHLADCHPTTAGLFDHAHNPLWQITPSYEAATELLKFWRRPGPDGEPVHTFADEDLNTRFLGDLYQDLSEHARKTYALLQTPEFVEEFILDLTLEPAVEEFGLAPELEVRDGLGNTLWHHVGLRTIDPACGSGHFLLGLFTRLLNKQREAAGTAVDDWALIRKALDSVHGCDKNPFAVSIARFRLLIAVLKEAGLRRLDQAPEFPIHVAVGDSLLHGRDVNRPTEGLFNVGQQEMFAYTTEDVWDYSKRVDLLGKNTYHVVVGNPPYITVKDEQEKDNYRRAYSACSGKYALSVPFAQRIFELASQEKRGFTGQITANSFMKREFGKKLIQDFFAQKVKLTHVIDTSGAFIPGHGTPTVILAGRNTVKSWDDPIREVLGVRGESSQPENPARGLVWRSIVDNIANPGTETPWVSVRDGDRKNRSEYPWSLSGGGADELVNGIEEVSSRLLGAEAESLGITCFTLEDDLYLLPRSNAVRTGIADSWLRLMVTGNLIRDWIGGDFGVAIFPYVQNFDPIDVENEPSLYRYMWPARTTISNNLLFGGKNKIEGGLKWSEYGRLTVSKLRTPLAIAYGEVATHNHFILDRRGNLFKQTAPVIKLSEGAAEEEHLRLLGVLNSSLACFWMKQVSQGKGNRGGERSTGRWEWEEYYQFNSTKLQDFPLPADLPLEPARTLDSLAQELSAQEPSAVAASALPTRDRLDSARSSHAALRRRMIALQEELDWQTYGLYGLLNEAEKAALVAPDFAEVPEVSLGERAFEIVLARKAAAGEAETVWFTRHGSTPVTEIPSHWPQWYRDVVQARIDAIAKRRDLALVERPECKRRWSSEPWEKKEKEALRSWLLDRCEDRSLWFHSRDGLEDVPRAMTPADLADVIATGPAGADVSAVAELYAADHLGRRDARLSDVVREITADQHVPHLAALRYKDPGLRKRAQWEEVWELQREEDRTGGRLDIAVPPKYASADFRKPSYWSHRGKLDVPKERFTSYPGAGPSSDPALVLGWAGWDHKQRAEALKNLVEDRVEQDGWTSEQVAPLLAGMLELLPWLEQWHGEYDEEWEGVPAEDMKGWLDTQRDRHHLTEDALRAWRPAGRTRTSES